MAIPLGVLLLSACGGPSSPSPTPQRNPGAVQLMDLGVVLEPDSGRLTLRGALFEPSTSDTETFFFRGQPHVSPTLENPILKHSISLECLEAGCRRFRFRLELPRLRHSATFTTEIKRVLRAQSTPIPRVEATVAPTFSQVWGELIEYGVDGPLSSVGLTTGEGETLFVSAHLRGASPGRTQWLSLSGQSSATRWETNYVFQNPLGPLWTLGTENGRMTEQTPVASAWEFEGGSLRLELGP